MYTAPAKPSLANDQPHGVMTGLSRQSSTILMIHKAVRHFADVVLNHTVTAASPGLTKSNP